MNFLHALITILCIFSFPTFAQNPFVTTWKTYTDSNPSSTTITIPTYLGETYFYDVDWNDDGFYDQTGITGDVSHDFGVVGNYKVRIRGAFPRIYFNYGPEKEKLLEINQWGDIVWTSMGSAFKGCFNLKEQAIDAPNLTQVADMSSMFSYCFSLNQNINNWNTSNVTNMEELFRYTTTFNAPLNNWNTGNVTNMAGMFSYARDFNQPINNWNTSKVNTMSRMFAQAESFNQPINNWNISNVTDLSQMFASAGFNQPLNNWNTSKVTDMSVMFAASKFNQPIENWNTSSLTNMAYMFNYNSFFNQPLNNLNTANVTNMNGVFKYAGSFNQSIGDWNLKKVLSLDLFMTSSNINCKNYSETLIGWANNSENPNGIVLDATLKIYGTHAVNARNTLISKGWTIIGDILSTGTECECTNMFSVKTGNWNDSTLWSCGRVPNLLDEVLIKKSQIVDLLSGQTGTAKTIKLESGAILSIPFGANLTLSN